LKNFRFYLMVKRDCHPDTIKTYGAGVRLRRARND
jgi:hypothetical protein